MPRNGPRYVTCPWNGVQEERTIKKRKSKRVNNEVKEIKINKRIKIFDSANPSSRSPDYVTFGRYIISLRIGNAFSSRLLSSGTNTVPARNFFYQRRRGDKKSMDEHVAKDAAHTCIRLRVKFSPHDLESRESLQKSFPWSTTLRCWVQTIAGTAKCDASINAI